MPHLWLSVNLSTLYPAPLLAAMLGDLGADVVKVEPPDGDALRRVGKIDAAGDSAEVAVAVE